MNKEDSILFSKYFYSRGVISNNSSLFDVVLNFLINSKEFTNSFIELSDCFNSEMLGLVVEPFSNDSYDCKFSIMYSVNNDLMHENRTMDGFISFSSVDNVLLIGDISRFSEQGFIGSIELVEKFSFDNGCCLRYYDYSGTKYRGSEYINCSDFKNVDDFKVNVVKSLKKNRSLT